MTTENQATTFEKLVISAAGQRPVEPGTIESHYGFDFTVQNDQSRVGEIPGYAVAGMLAAGRAQRFASGTTVTHPPSRPGKQSQADTPPASPKPQEVPSPVPPAPALVTSPLTPGLQGEAAVHGGPVPWFAKFGFNTAETQRLEKSGLQTLQSVASANPDDLAKKLRITRERAEAVIASANEQIKPAAAGKSL